MPGLLGGGQFPNPVAQTHGPWLGVKDGPSPTESDPQHAQMILNGWIPDAGKGGAVIPRPPIKVETSNPLPNNTAIGMAVWTPAGQAPTLYVWDQVGKAYQVGAGGGEGWGAPTPVPALNATPGSVRVYAVNCANQLIISDGFGAPGAWNGTTLTPILFDGVTSIPAYGPPTVYYDQVFFIQVQAGSGGSGAIPSSTLMWSEPNQPTLGYVQLVNSFQYEDTWTLGQTGSDPITAICGTNSALFYWRKNSTGALYGSPALAAAGNPSNFSTTATHDSVSSKVGCVLPQSVVVVDREIYFIDQSGRPQVIVYGGYIQEMWQDCYATFSSTMLIEIALTAGFSAASILSPGVATYDPYTRLIYWTLNYPFTGSVGFFNTLGVFSPDTKKYLGLWTLPSSAPQLVDFRVMTAVPAGMRNAFPIPSQGFVAIASSDGFVRRLGGQFGINEGTSFAGLTTTFVDSQAVYQDQLDYVQPGNPQAGFNTYAIEYSIEANEMLYDPMIETQFDRIEWVTLPYTYCDVLADYKSTLSASYSTALNNLQPVTAATYRGEVSVGTDAYGRFLRPRLRNTPHKNSLNMNCLAVTHVKVTGAQVDMYPGAP